jgi:uncharacterized protein (DUF1778 family)
MSTIPTPVNALGNTDVIEAMRSIHTESDRWRLAEALCQEVPAGSQGFAEIIDEAKTAGVLGALKLQTLRLYRDTAVRWPADQRVPNVSFSAHREAMVMQDKAAKMLTDLARSLGADKVTVASVRQAVAVQRGTAAKTPAAKTAPKSPTFDVLADIMNGAHNIVAAIDQATLTDQELDRLHAGLSAALSHVEKLRAKAARKAQMAAKKATSPAPAAPRKRAATTKARGDLRGL